MGTTGQEVPVGMPRWCYVLSAVPVVVGVLVVLATGGDDVLLVLWWAVGSYWVAAASARWVLRRQGHEAPVAEQWVAREYARSWLVLPIAGLVVWFLVDNLLAAFGPSADWTSWVGVVLGAGVLGVGAFGAADTLAERRRRRDVPGDPPQDRHGRRGRPAASAATTGARCSPGAPSPASTDDATAAVGQGRGDAVAVPEDWAGRATLVDPQHFAQSFGGRLVIAVWAVLVGLVVGGVSSPSLSTAGRVASYGVLGLLVAAAVWWVVVNLVRPPTSHVGRHVADHRGSRRGRRARLESDADRNPPRGGDADSP